MFDPNTDAVMRVERRLWLGLIAGVAAITAAGAPVSAGQQRSSGIIALPPDQSASAPLIRQCFLTQSSTGGFTIEYCRRFMPWPMLRRFYDKSPPSRFR